LLGELFALPFLGGITKQMDNQLVRIVRGGEREDTDTDPTRFAGFGVDTGIVAGHGASSAGNSGHVAMMATNWLTFVTQPCQNLIAGPAHDFLRTVPQDLLGSPIPIDDTLVLVYDKSTISRISQSLKQALHSHLGNLL
jgi:hypothetical protein